MSDYWVHTDDAIHAERGELIEIKGSVLPFPIAYVLLGVDTAAFIVLGGLLLLIGQDPVTSGLYGFAGCLFVHWKVRDWLTKDVTFRGLVSLSLARLKWWWRARVAAVRTRRAETRGLLLIKPLNRK